MLQQFLSFDKLIGTKLIKILYFLGLIALALSGIMGIFKGFGMMRFSFTGGLGAIVAALIVTVLGFFFWRFMCEIYMLFFRMSDDLRDIKNHQLGKAPNDIDV
ncbi:DUF4282 domain-containing protein [Hellea sp.]|nr:DUF4282 domain-containing protein [Hellea sp.]